MTIWYRNPENHSLDVHYQLIMALVQTFCPQYLLG